jgi:heme/copper-type cytochrome/quinol oxidase subunit 4
MKKWLNIGLIALLALAVVSIVVWLAAGNANSMQAKVDFMLVVAYAYIGLSLLALIVMSLKNIGKSRNNSKIGIFVYGTMIIAAVVLYFVGSSAAVTGADGTVFDGVFTLKATDMMLYLAYGALGLTVLFLLAGEIRKAIK